MKKTGKLGVFEKIGNVLALMLLFIYFVLVPLYFKNGYEKITTRKYRVMMESSAIVVILILLYTIALILFKCISKETINKYKCLKWIDLSVLAYALVNVISFFP